MINRIIMACNNKLNNMAWRDNNYFCLNNSKHEVKRTAHFD